MKFRVNSLAIFICAYLGTSTISASLRVPKGFEELARGQTILTDISLYGHSLGVFQSHVDLEIVQFLQPEAIAAAINKVYPETSALSGLLRNELGRRFHRNGNLSCSTSGDAPGCDFLKTETIDIIYDENNARINLFIGSHYLPKKKQENIYYEASAESQNALIHQQNINFVADKNYQSASVQGNGSLGVTDSGYLNVDWNWQGQRSHAASIQKAEVNSAYFRNDLRKRMYIKLGMMDARDLFSYTGGNINLSQLPLGKIRGVRAGSTLAWVNMNKLSRGTPVSVFLSRDARVDVYRDSQLLASFYLKAGTQELDSRSFPTGSYALTLRVYEDNQLVRTETMPYTGLGEVSNTSQWFVQAGSPDTEDSSNKDNDRYVIHAGAKWPVGDSATLTAGMALFSSARYWEGAIDWSHGFNSGWIDGLLTSRASYLHGSEGSRGNIQQVNYNDGFSLSFYRSEMTAVDCNSQNAHRYSFSGCYKSTNMMLSMPFNKWYGTLGYALNSNQGRYVYRRDLTDDDSRNQAGVPWEKVYRTRSRSRTWQTGVTRTFYVSGININSSVNAFMRDESVSTGKDKGIFVTLSFSSSRNTAGGNRQAFSGGTSWQNSKYGNNQLGYNAAYSQYADNSDENESGISFNGVNTDTVMSSVYGRMGGQYGAGSLTISDAWDRKESEHLLSGSGNYSSSLIVDRQGGIFGRWGDGTPSSAITVGVEQGDESGQSRVSVSVDSGGGSEVRGSSRGLFMVPGYRETAFDVTESVVSPAGISSEIRKGTGQRKVFMTPGKVFNRKVEVFTRYTWLGRLLDERSRPLEGAIPLNVMSWTPLGKGSFTLETTQEIKTLYVMKNNIFWQCGMEVNAIRDVIRYVGETSCKSTELAKLPDAEQKQAELMTAGSGSKALPTVKQ
ncbi:TcfC E-set like domain-containing protein [Erwinia sorbitola]|uniref:Fimbrial protein n=1 Tax=Erwinia sorbitola TaxID=2681984 RepID=A0A6I6EH01_9GAMM|nr:TcfC E-set like domain-containing protein [Erwinia sorbitola]MTD28099.1 fimbrial protein [Erwinia sorbitola]QGU85791.1 fimbrial protein [Erwinia sorbitola]